MGSLPLWHECLICMSAGGLWHIQVLQYHVIPNQALKAAQLTNGQLLASELQNMPVKVRLLFCHCILR